MTDETVIIPAGPRFIGKYRVAGVLGEGAMGVVYDGHDPDIDRHVAIKTVHRRLIAAAGGEEWLARFAREARAAGRALHPNLVTVFDYLQQDGVPFLVMEKIRSTTLEDRMAAPPRLDLQEIHALLRQVLAGLGAIHRARIVHRDLKPANVMLTDEGGVKLTDFGIARLTATDATGAGMVGTPAYMAPEQFAGGDVDARADIYACGVLAYELIAGRKPFQGGGVEALFAAVRQGGAVPPGDHARPAGLPVSPALDAAVLRAMSVEPADRFADAAEMAAALAAALPAAADEAGLSSVLPEPRRARHPGATVSAGCCATTMLGRLPTRTMLEIERQLVARMGPMGRVIARRAAEKSADADQMLAAVMGELSSMTSLVASGETADMRDSILRLLAAGIEAAGPATPPIPPTSPASPTCCARRSARSRRCWCAARPPAPPPAPRWSRRWPKPCPTAPPATPSWRPPMRAEPSPASRRQTLPASGA